MASPARTETLRVLARLPEPVGVRLLARIAEIHPHSAERALAALVREGVVRRNRVGGCARYALNRRHSAAAMLEAVFAAAEQETIRMRCRSLRSRARGILSCIRQGARMVARARESRHVT